MTEIMFHTYDIFNGEANNMIWYNFCHVKALKSGLQCKCWIEELPMRLELFGNKKQFMKYYLSTITKNYKYEGIKRLINCIFW